MDAATFQSQAWEFFLEQSRATTFVGVIAFALFVLFIVLLWRAQRAPDEQNPIDVTDWFRDPATGRTTRRALGELVYLFVSVVAVFYVLTADAETYPAELKIYFVSFMTVLWVARSLLGPIVQIIAAKFGAGAPPPDDDGGDEGAPKRGRKGRKTAVRATATVELPEGAEPAQRAIAAE